MIPIKTVEQTEKDRLKLVWFDQIGLDLNSKLLIEDLLSPGTFSVLYGESNSGKTFMALDMALRVAHGIPWFEKKVLQGGVIYVAAEAGTSIFNRVMAFKLENDTAGIEGPVPFAVIPTQVDLLSPDGDRHALVAKIGEAARAVGSVVLVVIDTLSRALAGGEENSSEDMGLFVRNMDAIRELTGAHVMVVHHSGKDTTKGARGHSLLRAAADHELEVTINDATKQKTLTVRKQRDMPGGEQFNFLVNQIVLGVNPDGKNVTSCFVTPCHADTPPPRKKLPPMSAIALEKLYDLLAREGRKSPGSAHIPTNVTLIELDRFRKHLRDTGVTDDLDTTNERQQWKRIKENLISLKEICEWQSMIWIPGVTSVTERDIP